MLGSIVVVLLSLDSPPESVVAHSSFLLLLDGVRFGEPVDFVVDFDGKAVVAT